MIEELFELAKANPILVAGLGTVLFGSVMYVVKGVPRWIYRTAKRLLTIELALTSDNAHYHDVLTELGRHRIGALARNFSIFGGVVAPGYGNSIAWYRGRLVLYSRDILEKNLKLDERLDVTLFSRDVGRLHSLVAAARQPVDPDNVKITMSGPGYWFPSIKRRKRSLTTVFANDDIKRTIIDKIEWFLANEEWYQRRGIPYKLVFLLHGPPGTGKTSLIYGMASHFSRRLCSVTSLTRVDDLLRSTPRNAFVAIEDIDMLATARDDENTPATGGAGEPPPNETEQYELNTLQALINTLDGLATPHGLIVFITTNHRDRLDHALIRPGRVDHDLEIAPLDRHATAAMFVAFYGEDRLPLVEGYTGSNAFRPHTGADLQVLFMSESAEAAVAALRRSDGRANLSLMVRA